MSTSVIAVMLRKIWNFLEVNAQTLSAIVAILGAPLIILQIQLGTEAFKRSNEVEFRRDMMEFYLGLPTKDVRASVAELDARIDLGVFLDDSGAIDGVYWSNYLAKICGSLASAICQSSSLPIYPVVFEQYSSIRNKCFAKVGDEEDICK